MAKLKTTVPDLTMNDGHKIPQLAFGVGTALSKKGDEGKIDHKLVEIIKTAIAQGYRHLDGAEMYDNEAELGKAIKDSKVKREELFVTTKAWSEIADIPGSMEKSLKKLGLDYVDLYLIHAPYVPAADDKEAEAKLQQYWAQMEELKAAGKARSIGVSNYLQSHLETTLATAKVVPAVNQLEFHPYLQRGKLLDFHKTKGIVTACYAPITPATKAKPGPLDELLPQLAKKYYVNEAEICLRYCLEKDAVAITTSSKEQRMSDYMRITAFKMTPKEVQEIDRLGAEKHYRGFWTHKFAAEDRT